MCGITGLFSLNKIEDIKSRITAMNKSIIHRGPDAGNFYINNNLALGHRRLSIIDVGEQSNQPMHSNSNKWHIVFNGEIYNFKEIKAELNYKFNTLSDTEVIIAAVEERDIEWFIEKANGMFSFAIYNSEKNELFLVRDRLGIKPLFYFYDNEKLIFGSEIKVILASGLVKAKFNNFAVDEYLANRYIRAPYTFFENIHQLNPGCFLKIDSNLNIKEKIYWDLPNEFNTSTTYSEDELLKSFDIEINKAIKYRLMADVPLGTYLSGGVDSSLITAITAKNTNENVNTYTIGFPELNEFEYSRKIAKKYNTSHTEIMMQKDDYINNWERLIKFKDAPLAVPNEIPLAIMSSKLKEKITVVLSGEGADELMGGYGKIFRSGFDYENINTKESFYNFLIEKYEYVPRNMRNNLLNTPFKYREKFDKIISSDFEGKSNNENIFRFFHKYHVKGLLQRVDMTTMQTSVEARVPFLDHKLIEFVYSKIPYNLKLKWIDNLAKEKASKSNSNEYSEKLDIPKYLLRKLSYKYLPAEIVERKKVGFPVPLTKWFTNLELLAEELLPKADWLKPGVYKTLIKQSKKEARAGQILWMFINIEMFKNMYFHKNWEW